MLAAVTPSIAPVLVAAGVLLAPVLMLLFLRTRRVACPATCRRCGYDVSRRPAESRVCSECGADVTVPGATRTTRRVPAPRATALAVALLLAAGVFFGQQARRFEWAAWYLANAPDAWIAAHAERGTGTLATRAFDEWLARYRAGRLSAAAQSRFHEHLLAWQADLSRRWDPAMGDLLLGALEAGRLSGPQASRFTVGAVAIRRLRTRPAIRPGDPVAVEYDTTDRGISRSAYRYFRQAVHASFRGPPDASDERTLVYGGQPGGWSRASPTAFRGTATPQGAGTAALPVGGRARLHLLTTVEIREYRSEWTTAPHRVEVRETRDVGVLPRGTPLGRPVRDPAVADAVARAVQVDVRRRDSGEVVADVHLGPAPVDRSFDVYVALGARRRLLGRRRAAARQKDASHDDASTVEELVPFDVPPGPQVMRLILVAGGEALRESTDQNQYWSGTIVFPAVPIVPGTQYPGYEVLPGN